MNDTIDRAELKALLINEGYIAANGIEGTIDRLLNLPPAADAMLREWIKTGKIAKFDPIEGIDRNFLRKDMRMKDPAIILAYGMLLDNPAYNSRLLKNMHARQAKARFRAPAPKN